MCQEYGLGRAFKGEGVLKRLCRLNALLACLKKQSNIYVLECVSKIPEYAISGVAAPFLRHKARLSAAKPSDLFLELTKNPLELADFPF